MADDDFDPPPIDPLDNVPVPAQASPQAVPATGGRTFANVDALAGKSFNPAYDVITDTPKNFYVTPGALDVDHGQDGPVERQAWSDVIHSEFRQGNTVASYFASDERKAPRTVDPNFDTWGAIKGTPYEQYAPRFAEAQNEGYVNAIKRDIDQELQDKKTLSLAPWWQTLPAGAVASGIDLPTLLPGGAFVKGARGGISLARSALTVGAAAGVATAAQEAVLHSTQQTRTLEESAQNVGMSVLLGGVLGTAGAAVLSHGEWTSSIAKLNAELDAAGAVHSAEPGSAGAAAAPRPDIEGLSVAGRAAGGLAKVTEGLNPALRILNSDSPVTRDIGSNLFENSLYMKQNFDGVASAPAVETLMKEWNGGLASAIQSTNSAFLDYHKAGGLLKADEFRQEVGRAMRRGDASPDPFIQKVAQDWRSKVFDPLKDKAIEAKLLPDDVSVETASSYFSRMWNRNRLNGEEPRFKQIVQDWVKQNAPLELEKFDKQATQRLSGLQSQIDEIEVNKLRRSEEGRIRDQGGEATAGDFTDEDIRAAVRTTQGASSKQTAETLTQWLHKTGGLVDDGGELAARGISSKTRPGFVRSQAMNMAGKGGGRRLDDAARAAWEEGFFPHATERPHVDEFLDHLERDFHKQDFVVREADRPKIALQQAVEQIKADLNRAGIDPAHPRFSTSEEMKTIAAKVRAALDAQGAERATALKKQMVELRGKLDEQRRTRFMDGDINEHARQVADEVHATLTGRGAEGPRPDFITVNARGPMKDRTFNIPDALVEDFLEHDVEHVGRRYARTMGADVELARKYGRPDMRDQIQKITEDYAALRSKTTDPKALMKLAKGEKDDIRDIAAIRDLLRGSYRPHDWEKNFGKIVRTANSFNYLRSMGEVVLASLPDAIRPAQVHGLMQYMQTVPQLLTNMKAVKMAVHEAQLSGNVMERVLGHRMATLTEMTDPYGSRGPIESFMHNATEVANKWNGIRLWTDGMKSFAAVMTQNRLVTNALAGMDRLKAPEQAYMHYLGIDKDMAGRIAAQFQAHGETHDGVRVPGTEDWTDEVARRTFRAAMNKDVDSIIVQPSVADVPLFARTPAGSALLQFKSFTLASHQKVILRGMQEPQARFVGSIIAMTALGMFQTYLKAVSGNRLDKMSDFAKNPGWWIGEGLDRSGAIGPLMEAANTFEKFTGVNPIKAPIKAFDEGSQISMKNQNRSDIGSLAGPSAGMISDIGTVLGVPRSLAQGQDISDAQKRAGVRLLPFNTYAGIRQGLNYLLLPGILKNP